MEIELNRIAIWQPVLGDNISVHPHPRGTTYLEKGSNETCVAKVPLFRYVKNYELDGVKFSLIVRTKKNDAANTEKELDKIAKKLDKETILEALATATISNFTYTNNYIKEDK